MGAITRDTKFFPFGDVDVRNILESIRMSLVRRASGTHLVVFHFIRITEYLGYLAHGFDTKNAFESEVCLEL